MTDELLKPEIYIDELPVRPPSIEPVETSIAAFAGWTPIGPANRAELVRTWPEFEAMFGGLSSNSLLSYAVYHFFENGGANAYVVKPVGPQRFLDVIHAIGLFWTVVNRSPTLEGETA